MRLDRKFPHLTGGTLVVLVLATSLTGCNPFSQSPPDAAVQPSPTPTTTASPSPAIASPALTPTPTPTPTPSVTPLPNTQVGREIANKLTRLVSNGAGLPVQTVTCPEQVEVRRGSQFECEATSDGQPFTVAVEITDDNGPQFKWTTKGLLVMSRLEEFIQKEVKDRSGLSVTPSCGSNVRVAKSGDSFDCQITDAKGQSRPVKVSVKDDRGNVDIALN